jgi:beta-glucosidase-like glycosyl hydrolase
VAATDHRIGARESAAVGLKQIYSPMVDVSHEPRWGRIAEAGGEDPYLNSVFAAARVKAAQGDDYSQPDKVVTSVKHYAAYGQPEGGRDYNTTDMSTQRLRNLYLPPFKAAVDAGADTAMCSFNAINGVPGCGNRELETDILKGEWGFDGFIESDYTAVAELRACPPRTPDEGPCGHGVAADGPDAAALALSSGTDMEMVSTFIRDYGRQLLADGRISMARLDDAVRRILRVKFRAGLFEHPFVDPAKAEAVARAADQVVLALGESRGQSGEAASRSEIDLPGLQEELIARIKATGKPFVVVLFNGRPLTLEGVEGPSPAILEAWFPGVQAGNAVADVLFGKVNPGGKLPVTFPRRVGQVPIYYNHEPTGRPCDPGSKYNSRYRDIPSCDPQYAFGYGLSYTSFDISNLRLSSSRVARNGKLTASVEVANTGDRAGDEVVQLYLHDPVASISQPVRRLRGFERVTLAKGQKKTVSFTLDASDFGFYDNRGRFVVEPGRIDVYAGDSSNATLTQSFTVR